MLLLAAAAVQILTLSYDTSSPFARTGVFLRATAHGSLWAHPSQPGIAGYVTLAVVLATVAAGLGLAFRLSRHLLLLAVLVYPAALELAAAGHQDAQLIGSPRLSHLAVLFLPPLVLLAGIMISASTRPPRRRPASA